MKAILILVTLICAATFANAGTMKETAGAAKKLLETNVAMSLGGVGIINTHLYILTKSDKNELLLDDHKRWTGHSLTKPQVVIFYQGKVYDTDQLPPNFNLADSILISFEGNKIKFFDFAGSQVGFYYREKE